ncbi:MAG: PDZ domain-containing protein [Planctomycetota bacterium]
MNTCALFFTLSHAIPAFAGQGEAPAQTEPTQQVANQEATFSPANESTPYGIDEAIGLLSSPKYEERDRATTQLLGLGTSAFEKLKEVYHRSDDFEVQLQIEFIVKSAYFEANVLGGFGFLGISQGPDTPGHEENDRIPEGNYAIRIASVIENTGAARAGLAKDDLLVALDGELFTMAGRRATEELSTRIHTRGPGTAVTLSILRGDQAFEISAVLGRVPTSIDQQGSQTRLQHLQTKMQDWAPRFASYWCDSFTKRE